MRGIPGSGKSTVAKKLKGEHGVIHSTDDKFINQEGEYIFDKGLLHKYHNENYDDFCSSKYWFLWLYGNVGVDGGIETVIVDNTNISYKEFSKYQHYATDAGYVVSIVSMPLISVETSMARNKHGVPEDAVRNMIRRWKKI